VNKQATNRLGKGLVAVRLLPVYLLLGLFKHLVPLRWLARWAWCHPVGPRDRAAERGLAAIVLRLSQLTGLPDRDCLQRSLLLYRVLSRAGAAPVLIIGFGRIDGAIRGHAWVMVDNQPVVQEAELPQFSAAFGFGVGGFMFRATESASGTRTQSQTNIVLQKLEPPARCAEGYQDVRTRRQNVQS
jgi:hypothetical protein